MVRLPANKGFFVLHWRQAAAAWFSSPFAPDASRNGQRCVSGVEKRTPLVGLCYHLRESGPALTVLVPNVLEECGRRLYVLGYLHHLSHSPNLANIFRSKSDFAYLPPKLPLYPPPRVRDVTAPAVQTSRKGPGVTLPAVQEDGAKRRKYMGLARSAEKFDVLERRDCTCGPGQRVCGPRSRNDSHASDTLGGG